VKQPTADVTERLCVEESDVGRVRRGSLLGQGLLKSRLDHAGRQHVGTAELNARLTCRASNGQYQKQGDPGNACHRDFFFG
jgi:hypothetical protein